ncbi:hypothetical protein [Spirochaeta africana]|uniref:Outer membrane protein beta-barrel domain-containing protein n=1 Tax=Spirochaeta africana (strain ATCC 700263 / DSM 8902 / Z-7692) TaxID=889378 RepID=H9ULZ6_SPIAZ|nr:hypothetical protein [Spirochaeta africana]AFG38539.1 hypothetical protein Spiaf_2509 [Spirochaeta africana DSM 8902]
MKRVPFLILVLCIVTGGNAMYGLDVSATAELGVLRALHHTIQIGESGYRFDYVENGGQEILLPYTRYELELRAGDRHEISFLYQPLTLVTRTRVDRSDGIQIDDVRFADDTPLDLRYGFDFYRGTYRYRIISDSTWQVSAGVGLQIRNASIIFDGYQQHDNNELTEARVVSQDLGPVPVLSSAIHRNFGNGFYIEGTIDGFYAPIRYLNLRDVDVIGWLYDAAIRVGFSADERADVYTSVRFLGGGSDGTGRERELWTQSRLEPRYTSNNLNLAVMSFGVRLR